MTGGAAPTGVGWTLDRGYVEICDWHGWSYGVAGPEASGVNGTTSEIDVDISSDDRLCASGVVAAQDDWGGYAILGVNLHQGRAVDAASAEVTTSGQGVRVDVSNPGGSELRLEIEGEADRSWCVDHSWR